MPYGFALHVGINRVDPDRYADGSYPALFGCDTAAKELAKITSAHGFTHHTVITEPADITLPRIRKEAGLLQKASEGDLVVVTFGGHGDLVRDTNGDEVKDQALVLYDRYLIDDEIGKIVLGFDEGVRLVIVADCCYSGTIFANLLEIARKQAGAPLVQLIVFAAAKDTEKSEAASSPGGLPPFTGHLIRLVAQGAPTYKALGEELMKVDEKYQYVPVGASGMQDEPPFCIEPMGSTCKDQARS